MREVGIEPATSSFVVQALHHYATGASCEVVSLEAAYELIVPYHTTGNIQIQISRPGGGLCFFVIRIRWALLLAVWFIGIGRLRFGHFGFLKTHRAADIFQSSKSVMHSSLYTGVTRYLHTAWTLSGRIVSKM